MPSNAAVLDRSAARRLQVLLGVAAVFAATAPARAQDDAAASSPAAAAKDPTVVIARTVRPRIAYRGVALEENPIQSEATTFPGIVFHGTMDSLMHELTEEQLGQRGSVGVATGAAVQSAIGQGLAGFTGGAWLGGEAGGTTPIGAGASAGGGVGGVGAAVGGATANIGSLVTNSVMGAVGKTQDGGP